MTTARRVGILGGTFDPIHQGHIDLGRAAERALGLTGLFLLPANVSPHRTSPGASGFHRFAMAALAVLDHPAWRLSDRELTRPGPSFTADTLASFHRDGYEPSELYFILGADAFAAIESWKDYPALLDAAHFAVVSRPGHPVAALARQLPPLLHRMTPASPAGSDTPVVDAPRIFLIDAETADVSATAIRARCAAGEPVGGMVPPEVAQHIARHGLYSPGAAAHGSIHPRHDYPAGRLHGQD